MKIAIIFAAVLAVSSAQFFNGLASTPRPTPTAAYNAVRVINNNDQAANILRYDNDIGPDGSYSYAFDTDNGISARAEGVPRVFDGNPPVAPVVSQGAFSWTAPGGEPISLSWVADEYGYRAEGAAIPTPPPIPAAILRALEFISRNPPKK